VVEAENYDNVLPLLQRLHRLELFKNRNWAANRTAQHSTEQRRQEDQARPDQREVQHRMITAKKATRSQNHQTKPNRTEPNYTKLHSTKAQSFSPVKVSRRGCAITPKPSNSPYPHHHHHQLTMLLPHLFLANPAPRSFTTLPLLPNQLGSGPQPKLTQTKLHSAPPHLFLLLQPYPPPPPECPKVPPFFLSLPPLPPSLRPSLRLVPLGVLE
jgi:hypothetical protein